MQLQHWHGNQVPQYIAQRFPTVIGPLQQLRSNKIDILVLDLACNLLPAQTEEQTKTGIKVKIHLILYKIFGEGHNAFLGSFFNGKLNPSVCTSISHLSSKWNWKKTTGSRWTCRVAQNIGLCNHKLKSMQTCTV